MKLKFQYHIGISVGIWLLSFFYMLSMAVFCAMMGELSSCGKSRVYVLQSLKYLLSGIYKKKFTNS